MRYLLMGQLSGIGGWQLYLQSRAIYLESKGYDVLLLSIFPEKDIKLKEFNRFKNIFVPETHMPPTCFKSCQRKVVLNRIYEFIYNSSKNIKDDLIIESTDMNLSMWGEVIAEHYNAKCFNFLLHSHFNQPSSDVQNFFYFKYLREELAGMQPSTLPTLFKLSEYEEKIEGRSLFAVSLNQISEENTLPRECEFISDKKKEGYYVISYFGNLEKPHFRNLCDFIGKFALNQKDRKFLFVSVGSSYKDKSEEYQKSLEKKYKNCLMMNIPSLYPVPKSLFSLFDLCIASHGCSSVSWRCGTLTIRLIDDVTLIPYGIMGIHVFDLTEKRVQETLDDLVLKVYNNEYNVGMMQPYKVDFDSLYDSSQKRIDNSVLGGSRKKEYYNIIKLVKNIDLRARIEKVLNYVFGVKLTLRIIDFSRIVLQRVYNARKKKETEAR